MKLKKKNVIVKSATDIFLPLASIFGIYVVMHGNTSPGGGFQGGVLIASALLLFYITNGGDRMQKTFHEGFLHNTESVAEVVYIVVALVGVFASFNFCMDIIISPQLKIETAMLMNVAVGYHVMAGVICLLILMLSTLHMSNKEEGSDQK